MTVQAFEVDIWSITFKKRPRLAVDAEADVWELIVGLIFDSFSCSMPL
jgi:hypothetical protein